MSSTGMMDTLDIIHETLNNIDKCFKKKEFIIIKDKVSYKIEIKMI